MRALVATWLASLPWLFALGCGPGVGEGFPDEGGAGDTDSDTETDSDSDTDTGTGPPQYHECPTEIQDGCEQEQPGMETLLEASELGPDVAFAAMGRNVLVAERTVDEIVSPLLVRMDFDEYDGAESLGLAEPAVPPVTSLVPVSVVGDLDEDVFGHWSLVLAEDDTGYSLHGSSVYYQETGTLAPLPEAAPPATSELGGMLYLQQKVPEVDPEFEQVCVFGDGLYCFDGAEWTTSIAPGGDAKINDLGVLWVAGEPQLLAVGDGGWIARRSGTAWIELDSGTERDLLSVTVDDEDFVAAGRDGTVVYGNADEIVSCEIANEVILVLSGIPDAGVLGIFESGPVFYWEMSPWGPDTCLTGAEVPGALETRIVGCDASLNLFVLTEQALHGGHECGPVE